jgi:hypothetical protein
VFIALITLAVPVFGISIVPSNTDGGTLNYTEGHGFYFHVTNRFYPYAVNTTFEITARSVDLLPYVTFNPESMILLPDQKKGLNVTIAITEPEFGTGDTELIFKAKILTTENGSIMGPAGTARINFTFMGNRPPVLISNIPDQTWYQDRSLTGLRLLDYFYDPDNDTLTFTAEEPNNINITITNDLVTFIPDPGWYGVRYTLFRACDSFACTSSNIVKLTVEKVTYPSGESPSPPPPPSTYCEERWICTDWSECIDGKQTRECADANNCGTEKYKPVEERACEMPGMPTTTTTTIPQEIPGKVPVPACREGAREPWLLMSLLLLIAFILEAYALVISKKRFVSWPLFVSVILVILSMTDYFYYICLCPEDCERVPWTAMAAATITAVLLLLIIRIRWIRVINRLSRLIKRIIKRFREEEKTKIPSNKSEETKTEA